MQSSPNTGSLSTALEQVAEIDRQLAELEIQQKELSRKREALANIAVEEMTSGRLDGVRVAGRSWRIEWEHSVTTTAASTDALLEAARAVGKGDALVSVNTARLKSLLREMAKAAGRESSDLWTEGTPFAGLVSEYVRPVLRHLTLPQG
jgi:hypothetical protein